MNKLRTAIAATLLAAVAMVIAPTGSNAAAPDHLSWGGQQATALGWNWGG
jgi:hypothetical protein